MAKSKLSLEDVCRAVTENGQEASKLCQPQTAAVSNAQKAYETLISKKKGKMDAPTITVQNCSSGSGGVIETEWTKLWNSGGKFYQG